MGRMFTAAAALTALVLVVAGCGGSSKSGGQENEGQKVTIAGVPANDHGTKSVSGETETELELDDYYFEPTVMKGTPGERVTLELKNEGGTEHNFSIDSEHIDKDLEAGDSAAVTVRIPRSGELSFYCKYHKDRGMAGALAGRGSATGGGTTTGGTTTGGGGY